MSRRFRVLAPGAEFESYCARKKCFEQAEERRRIGKLTVGSWVDFRRGWAWDRATAVIVGDSEVTVSLNDGDTVTVPATSRRLARLGAFTPEPFCYRILAPL